VIHVPHDSHHGGPRLTGHLAGCAAAWTGVGLGDQEGVVVQGNQLSRLGVDGVLGCLGGRLCVWVWGGALWMDGVCVSGEE